MFTACWMITEPQPLVKLKLEATSTTDIDIQKDHQQLKMELDHSQLRITHPNQLNIIVLQNGRWDNAVINPKPDYLSAGKMSWQHVRALIFDAADNEGCFHFMLAGIEKASGNKTISLFMDKDAQKCTRKRYLKMRTETNGLSQKQIVDRVLSLGGYDEDASATEITDDKDNDISDQVLPKKNFLDKE